jgi:hypothetical protein
MKLGALLGPITTTQTGSSRYLAEQARDRFLFGVGAGSTQNDFDAFGPRIARWRK